MENKQSEPLAENFRDFKPDPKYLKKNYFTAIYSSGFIVLVLLLTVSASFLPVLFDGENRDDLGRYITKGIVILLLIFLSVLFLSIIYARWAYRALHYEITESEIMIRSGVIFKKQVIIPIRTITNIDIIKGPIDRLFGLTTIHIQTAGSVSILAEGRFVGLLIPFAENLRNFLQNRLKLHGGDATSIDGSRSSSTDVDLVLHELRSIKQVLIDIRDRNDRK